MALRRKDQSLTRFLACNPAFHIYGVILENFVLCL